MATLSIAPKLPQISVHNRTPALSAFKSMHVLAVYSAATKEANIAGQASRALALKRRARGSAKSSVGAPVSASSGAQLVAWAPWQPSASRFTRMSTIRQALEILLKEAPQRIALILQVDDADASEAAATALYCMLVNGVYSLGKVSRAAGETPLAAVELFGVAKDFSPSGAVAAATGNLLARQLTLRPPNDLTPGQFRADIAALAKQEGWRHEEFDFRKLKKMGAGAFCAVAQGSPRGDAALVHLRYRPVQVPKKALPSVAISISAISAVATSTKANPSGPMRCYSAKVPRG